MKTKKTFLNRFIDTIEYWGNKLPHPFMLFGGMLLATLFISWLLARMGVSISYMSASKIPGEPEKLVTVAVVNLLSGDNLRYIIIKFPEIFVSYPPLKLVLVMMAASAFIEKTGFFETFMKKYLLKAPRSLITFAVVFVGINANLMSDAGTIFSFTMGGVIFAALGRNPLIGVILGYASASGGFTANLFLAGTDALLAGITESIVKEMGLSVPINPAVNYFFMAAATFVLSVTMTIFTEKVVCRMVGDGDGTLDESLIAKHRLTEDQEKGLRWAFYGFLFFLFRCFLRLFDRILYYFFFILSHVIIPFRFSLLFQLEKMLFIILCTDLLFIIQIIKLIHQPFHGIHYLFIIHPLRSDNTDRTPHAFSQIIGCCYNTAVTHGRNR